MSSSVESRIVSMKFDNADFEKRTATTLSTLDKLKHGLKFDGASKGLNDVAAASKNIQLSNISAGVDNLVAKFSNMHIVGVAALVGIAHQAIQTGTQLAKSLTITPITTGFDEYETKLGSIQTILTNTSRHGTTLGTVNAELEELNKYADKTIYSFSEMTKNASLFTNSGMKIEDATTVIKGFSNAAAASGTSATGAAEAAYQLSQALSAGKVTAIDWMSLTNRGMGGKNMQDSLIAVAQGMGTFKGKGDAATLAATNFKGSLEKGWLTADVMSTYLKAMSGDMTEAELAAKGLNKAQIKALKAQAEMGLDAATKVRTLSALLGTMKEAVGSGWATTWETVFGGFYESTKLFTKVNDVLGGFIIKSAEARNKVLGDWKQLGGRVEMLKGIENVFHAITAVLKPLRDAFRTVFPPMTAKRLTELSSAFKMFSKRLIVSKETAENIKRTFVGVFSVIKFGLGIVGAVIGVFFKLATMLGKLLPTFFALTAVVGDFFDGIFQLAKSAGAAEKFFDVFRAAEKNVFDPIVKVVQKLAYAFSNLVKGNKIGFIESVKSAFGDLDGVVDGALGTIQTALSSTMSFLNEFGANLGGFGGSAVEKIVAVFDKLWSTIYNFRENLSTGNFSLASFSSDVAGASDSVSIFAKIGAKIKEIWDGVFSGFKAFGNGTSDAISSLKEFLDSVRDAFKGYLEGLDMGDALALVNTAVFISMYRTLKKFMDSIRSVMVEGQKTIKKIGESFDALTGYLKTMQNSVRANILIKIAVAVVLLAGAMLVISKLNTEQLKTTLAALTVLFTQLVAALIVISKYALSGSATGFAGAGVALVGMATAVLILAKAMLMLGKADPDVLYQGGAAITAILTVLALVVKFGLSGATGVLAASVAMVIMAFALLELYGVIKLYDTMDFGTFAKGLAFVGLTLGIVGLAMRTFPVAGAIGGAAALIVVAGALLVMSKVLKTLGGMSLWDLAKALGAMVIALAALVVATIAMDAALPGAQAMIVVAGAIFILAKALKIIGDMGIWGIIKAIGALVVVFALLVGMAVLATVFAPFTAGLMAFGIAVAFLGAGLFLMASALGIATAAIAALAAIGIPAITAVLGLIPLLAQQVALGIIAFVDVIWKSGEALIKAFVGLVGKLIEGLIKLIPKFGDLIQAIIEEMIEKVRILLPKMAEAGLDILLEILDSIEAHIEDITETALKIVAGFIRGLTAGAADLAQAGFDLIIAVMRGITKVLNGSGLDGFIDAGLEMGKALAKGIAKGVKSAAASIAESALDKIPGSDLVKKGVSGTLSLLGVGGDKKPKPSGTELATPNPKPIVAGEVTDSESSSSVSERNRVMRNTTRDMANDLEFNPVIAPVLDLSAFRSGADRMNAMMRTSGIDASASFDRAASIASDRQTVQQIELAMVDQPTAPSSVTFEQNNYSPESLSTTEIYRQTNNQLSMAKKLLLPA